MFSKKYIHYNAFIDIGIFQNSKTTLANIFVYALNPIPKDVKTSFIFRPNH